MTNNTLHNREVEPDFDVEDGSVGIEQLNTRYHLFQVIEDGSVYTRDALRVIGSGTAHVVHGLLDASGSVVGGLVRGVYEGICRVYERLAEDSSSPLSRS